MPLLPGLVMLSPFDGRTVWVLQRDRAEFEGRGYRAAGREPAAPAAPEETSDGDGDGRGTAEGNEGEAAPAPLTRRRPRRS